MQFAPVGSGELCPRAFERPELAGRRLARANLEGKPHCHYNCVRTYYNWFMDRKTQAPVSTRFSSETLKRLDRRARTEGHSRSTLIQRYVAEGIETDEHPGIVFRSGPVGRRPGLVGGPDVWEVVAVHRSFDDVERTADWLDQPGSAVEAALRYYEAHRTEIDEWIQRNEEAAEAAERVARARQAAS